VVGLRRAINAEQGIQRINEIRTMHKGPDFLLANISADFRDDTMAAEIEATISGLDQRIKSRYSELQYILSRSNRNSTAGLYQ